MSKQLTMRVSLAGVTANAADAMMRLAADIRERAGYDADDESADDPAGDADQWVFMLRELSRHARETARGEHTVAEFADFYCLAGPLADSERVDGKAG